MAQPPLVLITGGEGDLAGALAGEFSAAGCEVLRPGRRELDVRRSDSVEHYFSGIERLDVLVNNAALSADRVFARLAESEWDEVLATNLRGAFLCSRAAARIMVERGGGHIVQVGSYAALHPGVGQAAYAASKAGLIGLTEGLARELGPGNVRVNCVLPGFLETRMTHDLPHEVREAARARHVLGRFNTPPEAARFIRLLTTFPHLSGQVFQLDSRV